MKETVKNWKKLKMDVSQKIVQFKNLAYLPFLPKSTKRNFTILHKTFWNFMKLFHPAETLETLETFPSCKNFHPDMCQFGKYAHFGYFGDILEIWGILGYLGSWGCLGVAGSWIGQGGSLGGVPGLGMARFGVSSIVSTCLHLVSAKLGSLVSSIVPECARIGVLVVPHAQF